MEEHKRIEEGEERTKGEQKEECTLLNYIIKI